MQTRCSVLGVSILMTATSLAYVNDVEKAVVGTCETMTVEVASDETWDKPVFVQGVFRKTGAGKLTLPAEKLYGQGSVEVVEGELSVTATGAGSAAVAEPAILNGAAMWLDASMHVAGTDGSESTGDAAVWYDVRETEWDTPGFTTNYIYAQAYTNLSTDSLWPTLGTDDAERDFVDFGGFGSGQYMTWLMPSGDKAWIPIANSFVAYSPNGSHGNYLGATYSNSKPMFFAVTGNKDGSSFFSDESNNRYNHLRFGHVFCNGVAVDPVAKIDKTATQLLETESYPVEGYAEAFFNFRNYQQKAGSYSNGNRVGGGRLHEVLIFTNRISEIDRVLVEQYLLQKWVNSSGYAIPPKFRVMGGAVLTLDGRLETSVQSEGVFHRTGAYASSLDAADAFAGLGGTVVIDAGATVSNKVGATIAPQVGKTYAADGWNTVAVSDGTAGSIGKTGNGALAFAGFDSATSLSVASGSTALRATATNFIVSLSGNCLADSGFEGFSSGSTTFANNAAIGAWTVTNYPFSSSASTRVLHNDSKASVKVDIATPEGSNYLLLKQGGGVRQPVSLSRDGRYEVTLRVSQRSGSNYSGFARIYIDGILVGTAQSPSGQKEWDFVRFETPWIAAGDHVFTMLSEVNVDTAIALDDVQLRWLDDTSAVASLKNGNFEDADWAASGDGSYKDIASAINNNKELPSTYLTGWTADGTVTMLRARPYLRTSDFAAPLTGTGSICAWLQTGASVSQTVTIPEDGLYVLSAAAANYATNTADSGYTSGKIQFTLGETSETIEFGEWSLRRKGLSMPVRLARGDSVEVAITAPATTASGRNNILVDDVRLERVTDNLVVNPSFECGAAETDGTTPNGWTVVANPSGEQILYAGSVNGFGYSVADGTYRVRLCAGTHLAQTLTLDPGIYRLSFWDVSRVQRASSSKPWKIELGPSPICVTFAHGAVTNLCVTVTPSTNSLECLRREFLVKVDTAGAWTLGFEATADEALDLSSFIDAVCLAPVSDMPDSAVPVAPSDAEVYVAPGAVLGLDWPGILSCGRLRCGGSSYIGDISSANAPGSLFGIGRLSVTPTKGMVIIVK